MFALLLASALAAPPTESPLASEATTPAPTTIEPIVVKPWEEPVNFVATAEPVGQSDDRTAARLEEAIRPASESYLACWTDTLKAGEEPYRYIQVRVKMNTVSGAVRKAKVQSSTTSEALDACVTELISGVMLDPPSMFPDRIDVSITFARPVKKEEED